MGMVGTFDGFTTARLGIYAAQHGLRVTGNNISNINTEGYTRQRLDQVSFKAGAYDRYRSQLDNHVGSGALVMNINQVRDPYLDIRYRNTNSDVGYYDTKLAGLQNIAAILDEVGKGEDVGSNEEGDGVLYAQIQELADALRRFSKEPTKANDILVRNAADTLTNTFHFYANKLESLYQETKEDFNNQVTEVNEILTNIRNLNKDIRDNEIFGDNALELRDERNRQIDKLSEYMHIKVEYGVETVAGGLEVEKLTISLGNSNPDDSVHTDELMLIDGIFGAQISSPEELPLQNPLYDPETKNLAAVEAFRYIKPDGGYTNDPAEAATYVNDNFTIRVSKMVDDKDREWTDVINKWDEATAEDFAIFEQEVTLGTWQDGDKFQIGDTEYTITDDANYTDPSTQIRLSDANDTGKMINIIAKNLKNSDYSVTGAVVDDAAKTAKLVFTAKTPGAVGGTGPAEEPGVTVTNGGAQVGTTGATMIHDGKDLQANEEKADGSEVRYSYQLEGGKWYRLTSTVKHTAEATLDDNDLHGSLQAVRELLTEAGEFSTNDTVDNVDENAIKKRGIPYYQKSLDLLAKKFADEYNELNAARPLVDQDGNVVQAETVKQTLPELKEQGGKVYAWNDTTKQYEERPGWTLEEIGGAKYAVETAADGKKYFTGLHGDGCNIYQKIPVGEGTQAIYDGLQAVSAVDGVDRTLPAEMLADIQAGTKTYESADVKAAVEQMLKDCLADHGTNSDKTIEVDMPVATGGPLFSNRGDRDDTDGITAANISVSHSWMSSNSNEDLYLVPTFTVLFDGEVYHTTQNDNADHMVSRLEQALTYDPTELVPDAASNKLFTGNFSEMFNNMVTTLGNDQRATTVNLNNNYITLIEIDTNRDGVSGVDLNDEAMNMMQYQKAMNAAMRLMTAIDEALDRLINNTGLAGR